MKQVRGKMQYWSMVVGLEAVVVGERKGDGGGGGGVAKEGWW